MKGIRIIISFILFLILLIYVENTKVKQSNNEQNVPIPTQTVLELSLGKDSRSDSHAIRTERFASMPNHEEIYQEIQKVFITQEAIGWADYIAQCESGYNPYSVGNGTYYGLYQYHPTTYKNCGGKDIYDWREQIMITKTCMYDQGRPNEFPACNRKYLEQ